MANTRLKKNSVVGDFCDAMNECLMRRFEYKRRCADWNLNRNIVAVYRAKVDLYLRLHHGLSPEDWPSETLVIARIGFAKQRVGHGTWLLERLVQLAPIYGYKNIALESAGSLDGIQNFIRKFGFQRLSPKYERNNKDWIISVKELKARMLSHECAPAQ